MTMSGNHQTGRAQQDISATQPVRKALMEFLRLESAGGILLVVAAVLALILANSPLHGLYAKVLGVPVTVSIGQFGLSKPLLLWINDGLMAIFFLLVGLEIKREALEGELSSRDQIVLPAIAAAGGLAGRKAGDAPQIILFPEIGFDRERFLAKVKESVERNGYCVVVASEGTRTADGKFLSDMGTRDAFGHVQLGGVAPTLAAMVKEAHGYKYHWALADYLQRSARHIASKVDVEQAYAVGKAAVELALAGRNAVMPVIVRKSSRPYRWTIGSTDIAAVANKEKMVPRHYVTADGFGITAAGRRYLQPLIEGEAYPPYQHGLPRYAALRKARVRRRLKTDFVI